jgi:tetratricopeptide (TPR) repeat protein
MQHLIEAYLNSELPDQERQAFEEALEKSPELRNETEAMRVVIAALARKKAHAAIAEAERYNHRKQRFKKTWIFAIACLMMAMAGWYFLRKTAPATLPEVPSGQQSPVEHPAQITPPDPTPEIPQDPSTKKERRIAKGSEVKDPNKPMYRSLPASEALEREYRTLADKFLPIFSPVSYLSVQELNASWEKGDYEEYFITLQRLEENNQIKEPQAVIQLARAACLLQLHRPDAASELLYPLLNEKDPLGADAHWLLSLCYTMQGKVDSARAALQKMRGKYAPSANALLKELEE